MPKPTVADWRPSRTPFPTAADQVLTELRERILSGALAGGAKLPTEKELCSAYQVSGNTVREAIRGLATEHLVEVRHGSGAYVTADINMLMAETLRSIIQVERIGVADVLATYGAVNGFAAELAASRASEEQMASMQQALEDISAATTNAAISQSLKGFLDVLADASGNPLLASICRFLASIQIGLATEMMGDDHITRKRRATRLADERFAMLDAIRRRDGEAARAAARLYQRRATTVLTTERPSDASRGETTPLGGRLKSLLQRNDVVGNL